MLRIGRLVLADSERLKCRPARLPGPSDPIAAGIVPEWLAYTLSAVLAAASLGIAWLLTPNLALVMAVYIGMQLAY